MHVWALFMPLIVLRGLVSCPSQRTHLLILFFVFVSCASQQIQRGKKEKNTAGQLAITGRQPYSSSTLPRWKTIA